MKRILAYAALLLVIGAFVVITGTFSGGSGDPTYKLQFDNAKAYSAHASPRIDTTAQHVRDLRRARGCQDCRVRTHKQRLLTGEPYLV